MQEKTSVYLLKPVCEINQSFKEGLRGGKLIKNLFRNILNNEAIIEFGFRMISKIMQISEHNSAHPIHPHSIITNSFLSYPCQKP